jgi:alkanesulfonate monooxygenase SsuD/methylene tetrahydromethanopterin reductase-like flavin-dependent oxidoreductase (luciferase family)
VSSLELNVLVQAVDVTDDHRRTTEEVARRWSTTLEVVRESPFVLVGSPSHVAEQLQARRERYGISYVAIFPAHLENFAPVVARLSGT